MTSHPLLWRGLGRLIINQMNNTSSPTWIWYPGDYEIWLGNQMNNRRTERGAFFPHFWKMDSHYVLVEFSKKIDLTQAEEIEIAVEGTFNIKLDGKLQFGMPTKFTLPAGKHSLNIKVWNQATPPAIFINGKTIKSDNSWKVTCEDKEWIDESGKASDTSATIYMDAESWSDFNAADKLPSKYKLSTEVQQPVKIENVENGQLIDFGKETFGFLRFSALSGKGKINIYYGESKEEALDTNDCETLDVLTVDKNTVIDEALAVTSILEDIYTLANSKAFRYVYIAKDDGVSFNEISMLYEFKPEKQRGSFTCDDEELNRIWEVGAYTMQLTTRECFIDGIKRDRWIWSGDAYQSYLMNYYLSFDSQTVKNTTWALRGKDPVTSHTNTILDYTFFWFLGIYDYYLYTGDKHFISQIYPRMQTLMDYVLGRTNANGMVEGQTGDWVFVDWADGYMDKHGELSFEQVLFCKSLETMTLCAKLANNEADEKKYEQLATALRAKLIPAFWNETKKALVHNRLNGVQQEQVTRYSNMFAVFFNYLSPEQKQQIKTSVLMNDSVMKISTPYMRFYELEALCAMGEQETVMKEMKDYWGGMIREGATSFWEKYNPTDKGTQHLAMYGRPYGKSLCHAWGASPIYLLGKYYLGIQPTKAGYSEFAINPTLGGLKWMEGTVPTPNGEIKLFMDSKTIKVTATEGKGYLTFVSESQPQASKGTIEKLEGNKYRLLIDVKEEVVVSFR
jgi:alpha-L-rhamnosidase